MGARQEYDPGKRQFILRDLPLLVGGLTLLASGCQIEPEKETQFTTLEPTEPLKLPPEPEDRILKIKEILQKPGGYVYGEVIGSISYKEDYEFIQVPPSLVPKIAVYYVEEESGKKRLLSKNAEDPSVRYYNFSVSPNGEKVALAFERSDKSNKTLNVELVGIRTGQERTLEKASQPVAARVFLHPRDIDVLSDFQWSSDSRYLSSSRFGIIWDTKTGSVVYSAAMGRDYLWSPKEGRLLISASHWENPIEPLKILHVRDGQVSETTVLEQLRGERISPPSCEGCFAVRYDIGYNAEYAQWSPDGERFAIRRFSWEKKDHAIHIMDKKGKEFKTFRVDSAVRDLTWSPGGKYLAFFIDKGRDVWENYYYEPYLALLDVETGEQVLIPTIREPGPKETFGQTKAGGPIFWTKEGILVMMVPGIYPAPQRDQLSEKILLLSVEELLNGKINIRDNKLGSGKVVMVNGYVKLGRPNSIDSRGFLTLEISQPGGLSYDLNKLNFNTGRIEFIRKGIGLIPLTSTVEKEVIVGAEGEMVIAEGKLYRLLNGKKYLVAVSPEVFKRRSDFKGLIRTGSAQSLKDIPEGMIAQEPFILDWAGYPRRNNRGGGVKNVYHPGLLTRTSQAPLEISLDETFTGVRAYLKRNSWDEGDNLYMTYDPEKSWFGYKRRDTMRNPLETIALLSQLMKEWKEAHPLDNFNLICHSLGGVIALHAAYGHFEVINNIITIDSPLKGIPPITDKEVRQQLLSLVGEKVVNFLLQAWEDESYQKRIREIVTKAQERGIGVYTFASIDDLIIPWQSAFIEGATDTINSQRIDLVFPMGKLFRVSLNPFSFFDFGHGTPLENPKILGYIAKIVGQNLATVT